MALLFTEGFDAYGDGIASLFVRPIGVMARRSWVNPSNFMRIESGRVNGYAIRLPQNTVLNNPIGNDETTKTVGCAIYLQDTSPYNKFAVFDLWEAGDIQLRVWLNTSGNLEVRRGSSTVLDTGSTVIGSGSWRYIEFTSTINNTTGSYELKIDGITELSDSGIDTQYTSNSYWNVFSFTTGLSAYAVVDDLYITDSTGSLNTGFLGPIHIETLFPDADITSAWTPSAGGNHYALVYENPADDDTTYVSSSTTAQRELFDLPALAPGTLDIIAATLFVDARSTGAEILDLKLVNKSSSTVTVAAAVPVDTVSQTRYEEIYEQDPDAAAAWTKTTIEAAQFGFEVG